MLVRQGVVWILVWILITTTNGTRGSLNCCLLKIRLQWHEVVLSRYGLSVAHPFVHIHI